MRKANMVEQQRKEAMEYKDMKNQRLRQKKSYAFLRGFISMCIFTLFTWLLLYSAITLNRVHENLQMRMAITS